jgi:hypothetical protein
MILSKKEKEEQIVKLLYDGVKKTLQKSYMFL